MRRLIYTLTVFVCFALVAYSVLLITADKILPEKWKPNLVYRTALQRKRFTFFRLREADTSKDIDILILGTSHAYRSYDTRIFLEHKWRAITLGSSSQTFLQNELLLKRYVDRLKPKFVVFDVYPAEFSNDGVESCFDLITNAQFGSDILGMSFQLNNIKLYNTLVCAFGESVIPGKQIVEPRNKDTDTYIKGGYIENYSKYKLAPPIAKSNYEINENQLRAFQNVIEILRERKIPYVLTQAPMTKAKYQSKTNNDVIDSMLCKYGSYYNFNKIVNIPMSGFKDEEHLNQYGVNIFDDKLLGILDQTISKACTKETANK